MSITTRPSPFERLHRWAYLIVLAALVGHAVVLAIWADAHMGLIDLQVYRAGGEHVLDGQPLYVGGVLATLPFTYPPGAALLFTPLVLLPLPLLKIVWTLGAIGLLGYVIHRCLRSIGVRAGPNLAAGVAVLVAVATWLDPVRSTLYLGQINLLLLALVVGDLLGRPDSRWRGAGVGLAAALKLTPLLFVGYLLLIGRVRAAVTATGVFIAVGAIAFLLAPADSVSYWLQGTFAAADRISPAAALGNHSLRGLLARDLGDGLVTQVVYLAGAALLVAVTAILAMRAHRQGAEVLGVTLCGLCTAAVAPFTWSHSWVWVVPLVVLAAYWTVTRGGWASVALLSALLALTAAVFTALPGPDDAGLIPPTGLRSLVPDTYLLLFLATLAVVGWVLSHPERRRHLLADEGRGPALPS